MASYSRPETLQDALELRAGGDVTLLAGGTDIYPMLTAKRGWGDMRRPDILDLSGIAVLRGIAEFDDHWRFGALTCWSELRAAALPGAFAGWQAAAGQIGGPQVQNRGSIAGNLCTASPAGDGIPCLLSLDATVELASLGGIRRMAVADFLLGYRKTALRPNEIVTAILVPKPVAGAYGQFLKLGARRYLVISIAMVAGVVAVDEAGRIVSVAIAVGACGPVARRLPALEAALIGVPVVDAASIAEIGYLAELAPIADIRASAEYRADAALTLVRDLLSGFASSERRRAA